MFAAAMTGYGNDLEYISVPDPSIVDADDVIIRIAAAGVCGSDVHIRSGSLEEALGKPEFPYILGHENVGTIVEKGPNAGSVRVGDMVALHPLMTCGRCPDCRAGRDMYCSQPQFPGVDQRTNGGFAEYLRTSERSCITLSANISPGDVVAATDAGLTAYHAVKRALPHIRPGMNVFIIGLGGVGQFALQCVLAMASVSVTAVDISQSRLSDARNLGANEIVEVPEIDAVDSLGEHLGKVDVVFDCAGTESSLAAGFTLLKRGGVLSVLGAGGQLSIPSVGLTGREITVLGNYVGHFEDLLELVALIESGAVKASSIGYSLKDAERAMQDLAAGKLSGRAVLIP